MVYHPLAWNVNVSVSGIALGGGPLSIVCISHIIALHFLNSSAFIFELFCFYIFPISVLLCLQVKVVICYYLLFIK